ncbi:MAG TPA: hypothetical protein VN866_03715, partial [Mycobacterium sp.]|nr:hypothetical protein [Mycobacterium sp.]
VDHGENAHLRLLTALIACANNYTLACAHNQLVFFRHATRQEVLPRTAQGHKVISALALGDRLLDEED